MAFKDLLLFLIITANITLNCNIFAKKFEFQDKIAIITGAAQGIGYAIACELLSNGVKGVTLVDIDVLKGKQSTKILAEIYGHGKVIFAPADVSDVDKLEHAFKASVSYWKSIDIVINNAAYVDDNKWRREIHVDALGVLHGTLLGFKYMSKYNGGFGGVITNIASIAGVEPVFYMPFYSAAKHFVVGLGRSLGHHFHYEYNGIRIVTVCPGPTFTNVNVEDAISNFFSPYARPYFNNIKHTFNYQSVSDVALETLYVIQEGKTGCVWVVEDGESYEIAFPDRKSMHKSNHTQKYTYLQYI